MELGWSFTDIDVEIVAEQKKSIPEIFAQRGEPEFRRLESELILNRVRMVQRGRPMVIALGGGAFTQKNNYELIQENGVTVWLDVHSRWCGSASGPIQTGLWPVIRKPWRNSTNCAWRLISEPTFGWMQRRSGRSMQIDPEPTHLLSQDVGGGPRAASDKMRHGLHVCRALGGPAASVERLFQFSLLGMVTSGYLAVAGSGYLDAHRYAHCDVPSRFLMVSAWCGSGSPPCY